MEYMKKCHIIDYNGVWENCGIESMPIEDAEIILHFQDIEPSIQEEIKEWQRQGKKVIVMQHGRHATGDYVLPRLSELIADYIFVWGQTDVERLKSVGITNYVHTGSLIFIHIKPRLSHEKINIVYIPSNHQHEHQECLFIEKILNESPYNVITKLGHDFCRENYKNVVFSDRGKSGNLDKCIELLQITDLVVGVREGTFEMLAYAMDIPVVIVDFFIDEPTKASTHTKKDDLLKTIDEVLANPFTLFKERKEIAEREGGFGMDTVSIIHDFLETL